MDRIKLKEWIKNNKLTILLVLLLTGTILIYYSSSFQKPVEGKDNEINAITEQEDLEKTVDEPAKKIIVHISGEVVSPGIIELDYGQRLYEAIEMAGGPTEKANVDQVNLAMILEDQQKVSIPSTDNTGQDGAPVQGQQEGDKININTADKQQLMKLPRIGEVTADGIIQYREENYGFKKIEDIKNVPRIGDATFEGLKDKISCY